MNVSTFIAKRYLFSKKSRNIINVISLISFFGILLSAASLIIILSAFNGIQYYVEDMYGRHAAELYIDPINGKKITADHDVFSFLSINEKIETFHKQIEETALLKFNKQWETANIIGTDSTLFHNQNWEGDMTQGIAALYFKKIPSIPTTGPFFLRNPIIPVVIIHRVRIHNNPMPRRTTVSLCRKTSNPMR